MGGVHTRPHKCDARERIPFFGTGKGAHHWHVPAQETRMSATARDNASSHTAAGARARTALPLPHLRACCTLHVVAAMLHVAFCVSYVACCNLCVARCTSHPVCRLLHARELRRRAAAGRPHLRPPTPCVPSAWAGGHMAPDGRQARIHSCVGTNGRPSYSGGEVGWGGVGWGGIMFCVACCLMHGR